MVGQFRMVPSPKDFFKHTYTGADAFRNLCTRTVQHYSLPTVALADVLVFNRMNALLEIYFCEQK
jgi:hypothetical protein